MIPDAIGRYQVFAQLGAGGFATVYRAYDPRLDRDVAVKVLRPSLARDPGMRERFLQEARALASVRHPHLVRLFDAGEADGLVYLAMEFIPGRSLDAVALDGLLPIADVVRIIEQTAAALDALHAAGLVHRDVKPANIMVADDGRAVLVDLGIARPLSAEGVTSTSLVLGTPGFLAPEQLTGAGAAGPRTDVYQLAATAFTVLAGRPPFQGSPAEVLYAISHRPAPDLHALCPDLPPGIAAVIAAGLAKDPRRRPASAGELAAALTSAALPSTLLMSRVQGLSGAAAVVPSDRGHGGGRDAVQPVSSGPPPARPRRPRFRWPIAVTAAGVALLLLGGSVVAVGQARGDAADTPRVISQDAGQQASPSAVHGGTGGRHGASAKPAGHAGPRSASSQ